MHRKVIWSKLAQNDFENILEYLHKNWDAAVLVNFIDITDIIIEQIKSNPKQFPLINKKYKVRKCVLTKQNTVFYRICKGNINILRVFDNRQDPQKLRF